MSTSGQVGTALPALLQDVYSCIKALIRKDYEYADEAAAFQQVSESPKEAKSESE